MTRKKKLQKTQTYEIKHYISNNKQVAEEIKREIKNFLETNDNENAATENL